jgi:hypothetical protein
MIHINGGTDSGGINGFLPRELQRPLKILLFLPLAVAVARIGYSSSGGSGIGGGG